MLVAKYNSLYTKQTIDPKIFEKGYSEQQIKFMRTQIGDQFNISCDMKFTKPYEEYPEYGHFNFVMNAYHCFSQSGVLPFDGPLSKQPAQIMEIFDTLLQLNNEREEDARRKAEAERKKNG